MDPNNTVPVSTLPNPSINQPPNLEQTNVVADGKNNQIAINKKTMWPYWMVFAASFLFSTGTALLVVWQSLRRIGEKEAARKFLFIGGLIFLFFQAIAVLSGNLAVAKNTIYFVGIGFPLWFRFGYFNKLKDKNEISTSFSWGLVGWTILGVAITFIVNIAIAAILNLLGILKV
jgi:hypothetical protein